MTFVSDRDPAINLAWPIRRRSTKAEVERSLQDLEMTGRTRPPPRDGRRRPGA